IEVIEKPYASSDLAEADLIIVAVNDIPVATQIKEDARKAGKIVNTADQPELCDFYLSSVVRKGNLKIAISTNGKSPTIAKRLKETFNELLPNELDTILDNMSDIRSQLTGDFKEKVYRLNELTKTLSPVRNANKPKAIRW